MNPIRRALADTVAHLVFFSFFFCPIDLAAHGYISPHVDNLQASGTVVAGLCLKSPSKMILQRKDDPECNIEVFLDKQCFYAQR